MGVSFRSKLVWADIHWSDCFTLIILMFVHNFISRYPSDTGYKTVDFKRRRKQSIFKNVLQLSQVIYPDSGTRGPWDSVLPAVAGDDLRYPWQAGRQV